MIDAVGRLTKLSEDQEALWRRATEVMYSRSQQFVHIDSADLKRSGRTETSKTSWAKVTGVVVYGEPGTGVDYAIYEFARAGSHDAIGRAFDVTAALFEWTIGDMVFLGLRGK